MNSELIQLCGMFLTATGIFFAALAVASNEYLKTGLSISGLVMSILWLLAVLFTKVEVIPIVLSSYFILAWVVSGFVHARAAIRENLGQRSAPREMQSNEK